MERVNLDFVAESTALYIGLKGREHHLYRKCSAPAGYLGKLDFYEPLGLYRVTIEGKDYYCVAESEKGAIDQILYNNTFRKKDAHAIRVPFQIRGWGGDTF